MTRAQREQGARHRVYNLTTRPTDFYSFVFPNLALDEPIQVEGRETTARAALGLSPEQLHIDNLPNLACHFRIGVGAVLITSDNQVVVSIRSQHQLIAGGMRYHLSAAVGMLRPVDERDGEPSPFLTCTRALKDELGLRDGEHFDMEADVRCIAIGMDVLRAQPYFLFFVRTPSTPFMSIRKQWQLEAEDRHENRDVVGLPWTAEVARSLAAGELRYRSDTVGAASNHARFGYTIAALHQFGTAAVGEPPSATRSRTGTSPSVGKEADGRAAS